MANNTHPLPQTVRAVMAELVNTREKLTEIINHDWVSVPLVYTQVGTGGGGRLEE